MMPILGEIIEIFAGTCAAVALGFSFVDLRQRPNLFDDDLKCIPAWGGWLAWLVAALGVATFLSLEAIEMWSHLLAGRSAATRLD
jgi:hypothetical protein